MKSIIVLFIFISSYITVNAQEQSIIDPIDTCAQPNFILDSLFRNPSVDISSLMGGIKYSGVAIIEAHLNDKALIEYYKLNRITIKNINKEVLLHYFNENSYNDNLSDSEKIDYPQYIIPFYTLIEKKIQTLRFIKNIQAAHNCNNKIGIVIKLK